MTARALRRPDGIDDPARPSGGNAYDRRLCRGLAALGWSVREHAVPGTWPRPDAASYAALAGVVRRIPDGAVVLLDGLVASTAPEVLVPQARRLRLVALVHMPLGDGPADDARPDAGGRGALCRRVGRHDQRLGAATADRLYSLPDDRVHVAEPGVDPADLAPGTAGGGALLCVAAVIRGKGHDLLLDALAPMAGLPWHCPCVGSLDRDPAFAGLSAPRPEGGLADRVCFPGPRTGDDSTAATPPPTCWCWRRAPRPTAWSSPRRLPVACR